MAQCGEKIPETTCNIGFIGGGNMARAIFDGFLLKKIVSPNHIHVSGPCLGNLEYFKKKGANTTTENGNIVEICDIVFLSVKPQMLPTVVEEIRSKVSIGRLEFDGVIFVSILAGTTIETIEKLFGLPVAIVRVMPNTAIAIGEGCTVYTCNTKSIQFGARRSVKPLLEISGLCLEVPESQINAIGALSGSGPAFMYLILEALADGGVKMGIPRNTAISLASQTMIGAAKMVQTSGKHSAQLKDEVCSAGGTTITGIHALEKGGVRGAIMNAIEAATNRSIEMSRGQDSKK